MLSSSGLRGRGPLQLRDYSGDNTQYHRCNLRPHPQNLFWFCSGQLVSSVKSNLSAIHTCRTYASAIKLCIRCASWWPTNNYILVQAGDFQHNIKDLPSFDLADKLKLFQGSSFYLGSRGLRLWL